MIEVREQKIVSMSHEMAALMETNQTLQGELGMAKEAGHSSVEELREEFTKRIGMSEKKLQAITRVCCLLSIITNSIVSFLFLGKRQFKEAADSTFQRADSTVCS